MLLCSFEEALRLPANQVGLEVKTLVGQTGFVFTARAEEQFYVSNNLPENLNAIFKPINPRRLDEDLLEECCKRAQRKLIESSLLEDFIAQAYTAFENAKLPDPLELRRPQSKTFELAMGRRDMLLALKRLWSKDWSFDAVLERVDKTTRVGLEARAVYVLAKNK
jgi:hypothetical protein